MKFWECIAKYLFPPKCVFCRKVIETDGVCKKCQGKLPYRRPAETREIPMFIDGVYSCFHYEDDVRNAVIRYKFGGLSKYSVDFSVYLEKCIRENLAGEFDVISWVPLGKKRLRSRGYDQAQLLALETCKRMDMQAVRTLNKWRNSSPQSRLNDRSKRIANILGAYEIGTEDVTDKRIILIDDVYTTGSTTSECARVLKSAGAKKVYIVTLAKARSRKKGIEK